MHEGQLFVVSGPSGAGKGTICEKLLEKGLGISLSVSMTTRHPRPGEIAGKSYYYISREEFENKIEAGGFLEHAQVYGNYYGTPKQEVLDTLKKGVDVILEIDIQGALQVKKHYPKGVFIFILPPSMTELKNRLTERGGETEEEIKRRMGEVVKEITFINEYDYYIINAKLDEAVDRAKAVIMAERSRVSPAIQEMLHKYKEEI